VNVSPVQFYKTDIVATVRSLLAEMELEPNWLELELTEGAIMGDGDESLLVLRQLRDLGVELAIDDFGTGYSSLSYLKRFPVQRLKIDQSFVRHSDENADDRAIVRTIIAIGKNLDMKVLAEGAETSNHIQFLASEGCDEAQGYYYARPLDAEAVADFLRDRPRLDCSH
jgi:EAL domain-containing protein (putative c-di-GMP-specific phosphodiesterase class I)